MSMNESAIRERLLARGREIFEAPVEFVDPTGDSEADRFLNDLEHYPHAYVIGCIMQQHPASAEQAWLVPYRLAQRIGSFHFERLRELSLDDLRRYMIYPEPLHHRYNDMSEYIHAAIRLIADNYQDDASTIWAGRPSSAALVARFREFYGVGPKISTMAASILVCWFKVPLSDYSSIDISADTLVCRVFERLGLVHKGAYEQIIDRARRLHPQFPGLLDMPTWRIGHEWCKLEAPRCSECYMEDICPTALRNASL